jgi:N-acyl-D-aspartate/D-glutamate deacylase
MEVVMRLRWLVAMVVVCCGVVWAQQVDLVLRHGLVVDGSGAAGRATDVGISGDRVVFVGPMGKRTAKRVIDATGLVVAPGFIDPHTHTAGDLSDPVRSRNEAYLMQGVTTVATGNDGASPLDIGATYAKWTAQGIGTNAALFIGQGSVRHEAMGGDFDAKPTDAQMARMKQLVEKAMQDGAIGISTGLYYSPGSFSTTEEVIELSKVAAAHGGIYDTHMRDESSYTIGLLASVKETIQIGREAGMPVMISHIKALGADVWGQSKDVIALIDAARAEGVKVTASEYPYDASGTSVSAALVPRWAEAGGRGALRKNLTDPAVHEKLVKEMEENMRRRGGAETLLMTSSRDKSIAGKNLAQIAQERKVSPIDAAIAIVLNGDSDVASFNMKESDIVAFMKEPWVMTCSDGSDGHPRKYGTFPKKYHEYVEEKHVLTLEQMVRSSTSLTAETLQLKERGLLKAGYFADVVVFDPKTFRDLSTYEGPRNLATGVKYLAVNGTLAIDGGQLTTVHAGRVLKH